MKTNKIIWAAMAALLVLCFLAPTVRAQGGSIEGVTFGPTGTPKGGVIVTVCVSTATVTNGVCTPAESDANCCFTDATLGVRLVAPAVGGTILSDGLGNFTVWAAPGTYLVSYSGTGVVAKTTTKLVACLPGGCGSGASLSTPNTFLAQQNFNANATFKAGPWVDITQYGARSTNTNTTPDRPGITASINSGSATATLSSASTFQNNDGVEIEGAGAACSLTTPAAPTVTAVLNVGGTGTGITVAAPTTGSTTYSYQVVPISTGHCYPVASSVGSVTTGPASLGSASTAITSCSRSTTVATCTVGSTAGMAVGMKGLIWQTTDGSHFGGPMNIDTIPDATHFTFTNGIDSTNGEGTTTTGGTFYFWQGIHIVTPSIAGTWEYCFYRTAPTAAFIGCGRPQSATNTDLTYDDWGTTMMGNLTLPSFLPSTAPAAGQANALSTTIVSGAGTTTLTLANAATTTVAGAIIRYDDAPAINAAATFARANGWPLFIPNGTFITNTYVSLPSISGIMVEGSVLSNSTIQIAGPTKMVGNVLPTGASVPAFCAHPGASFVSGEMNPGLYSTNGGGIWIDGFNFSSSQQNNANLVFVERLAPLTIKNSNFITGTTNNDYMGIGLYNRDTVGGAAQYNAFTDVCFSGGPAGTVGTSDTPLYYTSWGGETIFSGVNVNKRGFAFNVSDVGMSLKIQGGRFQGGMMPLVNLFHVSGTAGTTENLQDYEQDTTPYPLVSLFNGLSPKIFIWNAGNPSFDGVSTPGLLSGRAAVTLEVPGSSAALGQNINLRSIGNFSNNSVQVSGTAGSFGYALTPPAAATPVVSAGGSVPIGTWTYVLYAIDANGNYSLSGLPATAVTTSGNQTVTLTPPACTAGQVSYQAARSNGGGYGLVNVGATACGANIVDTFGFTNAAPTLGFGLRAGINSANMQAPQLVLTGGGFKTTFSNSFTANRTVVPPDGTGGIPVSGTLTTTAAASDAATIQGVTASSHCGLTPTNANAATDSTGTYVSAVGTNSVTVTHPANAGRTWNILCTPN